MPGLREITISFGGRAPLWNDGKHISKQELTMFKQGYLESQIGNYVWQKLNGQEKWCCYALTLQEFDTFFVAVVGFRGPRDFEEHAVGSAVKHTLRRNASNSTGKWLYKYQDLLAHLRNDTIYWMV